MKKVIHATILGSLLAVVALTSTSCAGPVGLLYTDATLPFHPVVGRTGTKRGEACSSSILGLIAMGDGGIEAARRAGGITNVATVDHKITTILGLYSTFCSVVTGT